MASCGCDVHSGVRPVLGEEPVGRRCLHCTAWRTPWVDNSNPHRGEVRVIPRYHDQVVGQRCSSNQRISLGTWVRDVQCGGAPDDRYVDWQDPSPERTDNTFLQPRTEQSPLPRVAPLYTGNADLDLQQRDHAQMEREHRLRARPGPNIGVGTLRGLAQLADDICVKQKAHGSSTLSSSCRRGTSRSAASSMLSQSTISGWTSVSRRYSSIDISTCAGRPRSVIMTGALAAARLAALTSWLNSREDSVTVVTTSAM
jgi:hypothetical protein